MIGRARFRIFLFGLILAVVASVQAAPDNKGTEFNFSFQNNYENSSNLSLHIASDKNTQGVVEIPGLGFSEAFFVQANQVTEITIPSAAQALPKNGKADLGILVTALDEVTVSGFNLQQYTSDAFLVLPSDVLGNEYIVLGYFGHRSGLYPSEAAIVATVDNTTVEIIPSRDIESDKPAGQPFTVSLNRNEVYQFSSQDDLTGSYIRSTAPVAVMSGAVCSNVPRGGLWCDHLSEMMIPLSAWGRSYLTVPLASKERDVVRILASENNTEVRINGSLITTLNRWEFHETVLTERAHIEASAPIMVSQYAIGGVAGDPFMAILPANEQFLSSYIFSTPGTGFERYNYVNVVIPGGTAIASLQLDGVLVDPALFSPIGAGIYEGAQIPVTPGNHLIKADEPFGLMVYGFNLFDSYGYPGGMSLAANNPLEDPFAPNASPFKHIGFSFHGMATDSEDTNVNGILDAGEDLNGNGFIDRRTEDVNGNDILDAGEDLNGNGLLDTDRGIWRVQLLPDAVNLSLDFLDFIAGQSPTANFTLSLVDNTQLGLGTLRITDLAGNETDVSISIPSSAALTDLHVITTVSGDRIEVDQSSFTHPPSRISIESDKTVIEWQFETFLANHIEDLAYEVILKDPTPGERRLVTQKVELNYLDINEQRVYSDLGPQYVDVTAPVFSLAASTDMQNYGSNTPVELTAVINNQGTYAGNTSLELIVEDSNGVFVSGFGANLLTSIAPGASHNESATWNTGRLIVGHYQLRAILRSQEAGHEGEVINEAIKAFAIVTSTVGIPQTSVNLTVGYDLGGAFVQKLFYNTDDLVQIEHRITNLTVNAYLAHAEVKTEVVNSSGHSIFSKETALNSLAPGTVSDIYVSVPLMSATPGTYSVQSTVIDIGTSAIIASGAAQFSVQQNVAQSIQGTVKVESGELLLQDDQRCTHTVNNFSAFDLDNVKLQLSLIRLDTKEEIHSEDRVITLAAGETRAITHIEPTVDLTSGEYLCVLRTEVDGEYQTLNLGVFNLYNLIADSGSDQTALVGETVTLNGANSRDAFNMPLSYQWSFTTTPDNSSTALSDATAAQPHFIVDQQGIYTLQLIVSNGTDESKPKRVSIVVDNRKAVANAGLDQSVQINDLVTLDGSNSSDLDGDTLGFNWKIVQQPAGSSAELSSLHIVNPTITIDVEGIYIAELTVDDGFEVSDPDQVLLNVGNVPSVANAGADLAAQLNDRITLDGSGSHDANGDLLSYQWRFVGRPVGSSATLLTQLGVKPSFTVDVAGEYVIELTTWDGLERSDPDTVTVTVGNSTPVANAGADLPANVGQTIILNGGESSDLNGDALSYRWSLLGRPGESIAQLSNPYTETPQFYVDKQGDYILQLIVNDGTVDSSPDITIVRVGNVKPIAYASLDSEGELFTGDEVFLGGYGYDPDGDPITYQWRFSNAPSGSAALLQNADSSYSSFTLDQPGTYVVQLMVNDGQLDSSPTSVFVQGVQACVENFAIRPKSGKVQLTWTYDPNTESYGILRSIDIDGPYSQIAETNSEYATYLDSGLTNGETYYYRIERSLQASSSGEYCEYNDGYGEYFDDYFGGGYSDSQDDICLELTDPGDRLEYGCPVSTCIQQCQSQVLASMPSYRVRMAYVPDLHGMTETQAIESLTLKRLVIGEVTTQRTTAVPPGQVIQQNAPRKSVLPQGTAVDIVLSTR